jgi:type IV pilus biogenesis protein PilP
MMGDKKPNFALDLSNEDVTLWHRRGGSTWSKVGVVSLKAVDCNEKLKELRNSVSKRAKSAIIRLPRKEVLLSKVHLGVFQDEAATRHARKQITEMSPYAMDDILFDLGDRTAGNMAPVGIVARQTLIEAAAFAKASEIKVLYFTTQYTEKEFTREPRFYLRDVRDANKPFWFVPWVAAASIGLAAGYFSWNYLSNPNVTSPTFTAQMKEPTGDSTASAFKEISVPEPDARPIVEAAQVSILNLAPAVPNLIDVIKPPIVTNYPALLVSSFSIGSEITNPLVARLITAKADVPTISISSTQLKTIDLLIDEAHRDLPVVFESNEIVSSIEAEMAIRPLDAPVDTALVQLIAVNTPDLPSDPALITGLSNTFLPEAQIDIATTQTAARPIRPPSPITAKPGTLTPTVEGTPGPNYITIFKGRPANAPRNRIDPIPPRLELAKFRPLLRPLALNAPTEVLAAAPVSEERTILDLADPNLRLLRTRIRPTEMSSKAREAILTSLGNFAPQPPADQSALIISEPVANISLDTATTEVAAAGLASSLGNVAVDITTTSEMVVEMPDHIAAAIAQDTPLQASLQDAPRLTLSDPAMLSFRTRLRPSRLTSSDQLVALAIENSEMQIEVASTRLTVGDPTLSGLRSRMRPKNLRIETPKQRISLLLMSDQNLAGIRTRARPSNLRMLPRELETEFETQNIRELIEEAQKEEKKPKLIIGTKQAVSISLKPTIRPNNPAQVVRPVTLAATRTSTTQRNDGDANQSGVSASGFTRATAKLPRSARGTVKSSPATSLKVAKSATEKSNFKKSQISLVGIFGDPNKRRALIRLSSGRYVKVQTGDKIGGWKISAISENSLRINKDRRNQTLRIP